MSDNEIMMGAVAFAGFVSYIALSLLIIKGQRSTIESQQDTINKLLNREPVTYKEVGQPPDKPNTERVVAWGGQIMDRDDLNES